MRLRMHVTGLKNLVSRRAGTISTGTAMRGLAVGALIIAGTGMYFGMAGGLEGNPASSNNSDVREWRQSYLPGVDRLDDQIAAELAAGNEEYQVFLTDPIEVGPKTVSSNSSDVLEWQRSHLPGIDRLDDQIAAELAAGNEEYQVFLTDPIERGPNSWPGQGEPGQAILEPGGMTSPVVEDYDLRFNDIPSDMEEILASDHSYDKTLDIVTEKELDQTADLHFGLTKINHTDEAGNPFPRVWATVAYYDDLETETEDVLDELVDLHFNNLTDD